ncbi:methyl-accepting chemotaxis protein [Cohnella faecalis]|uniref:Methyl-accepting chemotaxis protein n=1 Tax=Cohnella faecalis TaxID=2315694 RepID=A0A398CM64_9BACL|nr:methyl-accepting chemotaxis protein [Cohnella faecalis]RIE00957.1 methyl-accepting chemotaxis protein [Cohnella faecalis]
MNMRHLSVKAKLLLMLIVPLLLFATTSVYLLTLNSSNINHLSDTLFETGNRSSSLVLNADRDMYQALTSYMTAISESSDDKKRDAAVKDFQENVGQVNDRLQQAITIVHDQGLGDRAHPDSGKSLEQIATEVRKEFDAWAKLANSHLENMQNITPEGEDKFGASFNSARDNVNQFGEIIDSYSEDIIDEANADKKKTNLITYSSLIVEWIVLLTAGALLIRQISRTVHNVMNKTRRVSEGFLDVPQQTKYSNDELGRIQQSIDSMIGRMRELIGSIADNTRSVAAASDELHASANESSLAAGHVAENIQEVTSLVEAQSNITAEASKAMEEMAIGVQRIAESTGIISEHASDTNGQADYGNELLIKLRGQLDEMSRSIINMSRSVFVLNEKSERIGAITEKITGFANQTGILSLNASIEAARAGEHGRGFAVVAGEIRKLAASSLESANTINDLIADTRTEIGNASAYMKSTVSQAEKGTAFMEEVADGFQAIAASIKQVASQIHDTSAVTEQMSASSEEVSASMEQSTSSVREVASKAETVAAATEEQLALVENIAHSAEQLQEVVRNLNKAVHYFKL